MGFVPMFIIMIPALALATADEAPAPSFELPTPDGWRTETIPFPLDFAPELAYVGLEELRFAPGMFEPDREDFWTYAFVWWIEPGPELTPETLARDLTAYFEGLTAAVVGDRDIDTSGAEFSCRLEEVEAGLAGVARTFDPFVSHANHDLNVRIRLRECPSLGRRAVIFELSPQPFAHAVWTPLAAIRNGFHCAR